MDEQAKYERAKKRVEEIKGFYTHLIVYVIVNIGLFVINMLTSPEAYWFYWPLLGWGIGVLVHGVSVFAVGGLFGSEWEQKKIKGLMEKEDRKDY